MFAKAIIDSDAFLDMGSSAQSLYFHLAMRADDEGFVNNPKRIQRMTGAADDDLRILIAKKFIIPFESGIVVIKHWRIHNYIRGDRLQATKYKDERQLLTLNESDAYTLLPQIGQEVRLADGSQVAVMCQADDRRVTDDCPNRIGKVSLGKDRLGKARDDAPSGTSAPALMELPVISMPLNDGSSHVVTQSDLDRFTELYPAVDALQALRSMVGWLENNPTKKKTGLGIKRFINSWMAKEQDRGGSIRYAKPVSPVTYKTEPLTSNPFLRA